MPNCANRVPTRRWIPATLRSHRITRLSALVATSVVLALVGTRLADSDAIPSATIASAGLPVHALHGAPDNIDTEVAATTVDANWQAEVFSRLERQEYVASVSDGGLHAVNRAHNLGTHFRDGGIDVAPRRSAEEAATWQLTWRTSRWGRAGQLERVSDAAVAPRLEGSRVTYAREGLDEWYENKKEGLEQGFTVHERPSGDGPLMLVGNVGGGLRPELRSEEAAIDFLDERGARVLRYGGLHVWGADSAELTSHLALDGLDIALVIEDEGAEYPLTVDPLLTSPAWTAESNQPVASFGTSVATAGDVNGDGFSDVIVGAWLYDNGESGEGRAFVYLGSALGLSLSPAWTAESDQAGSAFGYCVASAGDVNGDGFSDVIVGAFRYDNGQTDTGRAFVYHGSASGLGTTAAWTAESDQASSAFGLSLATAGDVNGDGFSDVIVGALAYDNGETDEGRAFVYLGSAAGLGATAAWTAEANQATTEFGASVATAGDVNGDGFSDVIVGASVYDNGESDEGRAFAYHGSAAGLGAAAAWTTESNQTNGRLGNCVATAGDVNGDGFSDVIVGVWQYDNVEPNEGRVYAYHGSATGLATTPAWSAEANQTTARYGWCVATAGDVNGDGFADVIVGAYEYDNVEVQEGRAFVYQGSATGLGGEAWRAEPNQASARFGIWAATAGDVNGDGFSDVIVGADQYDSGEINEGRAFVYQGSAASLAPAPAWTVEGNQLLARLGWSVSSAGDVNGDGYGDVIVGAYSFDNGQTDEGRAFVYHGSAAGLSITPAWAAESDQAGAVFGVSVATAGDVNGDGYSDAIVGASGFDGGQDNEGRAYVYYGSAGGLAILPAWIAESDQADGYFGISVATAGDVNGDGFSDVVVGATGYDNGQDGEGRAVVYHGSTEGLTTAAAWIAESGQAQANFATAVATAGDVNGDGFSDIIVGASLYDNGHDNEGRAFVYHGSEAGLALIPAWTAESDQSVAYFGNAVATAGDVNGDGYSDVIVGAYQYNNEQEYEGRAFVYHGSAIGLNLANWTSESNQGGAAFGSSVSTAGDVNGDGFSDVIVGATEYDNGQQDEGRAFIYHGSAIGLSSALGWTAESDQLNGAFGRSVAAAGDVNGDGYGDVIVGASDFSNGNTFEGRAFVYYGNGGDGLERIPQQWRMDDSRIEVLGLTDDPHQFRLRILGRTPAGRGRVRLEGEVQPYGTPFAGGANISREQFEDTGAPGPDGSAVQLAKRPGLDPGTLYCWRVRTASDSPFFPRSPWFTLAVNALTEADLRTAPAGTGVAESSSRGGAGDAAWLEPIAPNPVTADARLSYTLPERGPVRLAVYDVSGREVLVLADKVQDAGRYTTYWDGRNTAGRNAPAGVYFARLNVGRRVEARKIVLAR